MKAKKIKNKKILIVDDEFHIRYILERFLKKKGYDVISAGNGKDAIESLKIENPDLVLLDVVMGGMGGIEVLHKIRQIQPDVRVLMITGLRDAEIWRVAFEEGCRDYIGKPLNFNYLENIIRIYTS